MSTEVLKFGSSVLRSPADLHIAVDEIYRRWRSGARVLGVVSAFEGVTDELLARATAAIGAPHTEAMAAYVATGEQQTASLLLGALLSSGIPARLLDPREIRLLAIGTFSESMPDDVDVAVLERAWVEHPVLILPGFFGVDAEGRVVLFGRGGSDLSALFLAAKLNAKCRLVKDVSGVFDEDPAKSAEAHRFSALSWDTALKVAGPLIQPKALRYAQRARLSFEVGRPNEHKGTHVGHERDESAPATASSRPLAVALVGCGVVGRGVYEALRRYPEVFALRHVLVREVRRYAGIEEITDDSAVILRADVDVVVVCISESTLAYPLIERSLDAGKFVVTANKAAVAEHGRTLLSQREQRSQRLWYSAAVGGALPVIEVLARLKSPVREMRGILNSTSGVVLDALGAGKSLEEAIGIAKARGFAEADPSRDLSGRDSADKLLLMIATAFGTWLSPGEIPTAGIDSTRGDVGGYKLIARSRRTPSGIVSSVAPERPATGSFLDQARGGENRLEIELETGEVIRLRGQGAGRWPTTTSIMGDLHDLARRLA